MRRAHITSAMIAAALLLPGAASAQQRSDGVDPRGAASSPATERPGATGDARGRSGSDDCAQGSATGADCSPSHVGSDDKSQVPPVDGSAMGTNRPVGESSERPSGGR